MPVEDSIGEVDGKHVFVERQECEIESCSCCDGRGQHIYHHYDNQSPRVSAEVERGKRGVNFKVSVSSCKTVDEAINMLRETTRRLQVEYHIPADKN